MGIKNIIPKIILILSFSLVLILWPITFLSLNDDIWLLLQKRNSVILIEEEIGIYDDQIVSFFKNNDESLNFFTSQELSHMEDVKDLITKANLLFTISIITFLLMLIFSDEMNFITTTIKKVSLFVSLFIILLLITSIIGFTGFFLGFHKVFFVGNYLFSPDSMLKILYPDNFFRDISILYFILSIVGCLATFLPSYKLKV